MAIQLKSASELNRMREANRIVSEVFGTIRRYIKAGISTGEIDKQVEREIRARGAEPAFLGYRGFPASACISLNEEVVHGIPGSRRLQEGDAVSIDIGVCHAGFYGDMARTFAVGRVSEQVRKLLVETERALRESAGYCQPGNRLGDVSNAVEQVGVANGYGIVTDFVGHGIGCLLHEDPQVPNVGDPHRGPRLRAGMVIAIEPMFNLGTGAVEVQDDHWTVVTKDRKWSAHFEDTVAITETGPEVLTHLPDAE